MGEGSEDIHLVRSLVGRTQHQHIVKKNKDILRESQENDCFRYVEMQIVVKDPMGNI